jgi:WD40 repeat protein
MAASDGSFVAAESDGSAGAQRVVRVWDPDTLEIVAEFDVSSSELLMEGGPTWTAAWEASTTTIIIRDIPSGEMLAQLGDASFTGSVTFSPSTSLLYVADVQGGVWVYDTSSWELVASWDTHDAQHRGLAISPDGARLVTTAEDNFVKVWDVSEIRDRSSVNDPLPLIDRIPAPKPSDAAWVGEDRLIVFLADGARWFEVSLAVDALVADATEHLTRSFTVGECATYQIDPCPTLDDIRSR